MYTFFSVNKHEHEEENQIKQMMKQVNFSDNENLLVCDWSIRIRFR